jgi:hypothetical protein
MILVRLGDGRRMRTFHNGHDLPFCHPELVEGSLTIIAQRSVPSEIARDPSTSSG